MGGLENLCLLLAVVTFSCASNWRMEAHTGSITGTSISTNSFRHSLQTYVCGSCNDGACSATKAIVSCPTGQVINSIITAQYGKFTAASCSCGYTGLSTTSSGPCTSLSCTASCTCQQTSSGGICQPCSSPTTCTQNLVSVYASCIGASSCLPKLCGPATGINDPCAHVAKTFLMEVTCASPSSSPSPSATSPSLSPLLSPVSVSASPSPPPAYVCGSCTTSCSAGSPLVVCPSGKVITRIISATYGAVATSGCTCSSYPGTFGSSSVGPCSSISTASGTTCSLGTCCGSCGSTGIISEASSYSGCLGQSSCSPIVLCQAFWGQWDPCQGVQKQLLLEVECDFAAAISPSASPAPLVPAGTYVCGTCADGACSTSTSLVTCPAGTVVGSIISATYGVFSTTGCACNSYPGTAQTSTSGACTISISNPSCAVGQCCDSCGSVGTIDDASFYQACVGQTSCAPIVLCSGFWGRHDPCASVAKKLLLEVSCVAPSVTSSMSLTPAAPSLTNYVCGSCTDSTCSTSTNLVTCAAGKVIIDIVSATYGAVAASDCSCSYPATAATTVCTIQNTMAICSVGTCCGTCGTSISVDERSYYYNACVGRQSCAPIVLCSNFWGPWDPCSGTAKTLILQVQCGPPSSTPSVTPSISTTASVTASRSQPPSASNTASPSATASSSASASITPSLSASTSSTVSPSRAPSTSSTPSATAASSVSASLSASQSVSLSAPVSPSTSSPPSTSSSPSSSTTLTASATQSSTAPPSSSSTAPPSSSSTAPPSSSSTAAVSESASASGSASTSVSAPASTTPEPSVAASVAPPPASATPSGTPSASRSLPTVTSNLAQLESFWPGHDTTVTLTLSAALSVDVTVTFSLTGSLRRNHDFSVTGTTNNVITIRASTLSASITLSSLNTTAAGSIGIYLLTCTNANLAPPTFKMISQLTEGPSSSPIPQSPTMSTSVSTTAASSSSPAASSAPASASPSTSPSRSAARSVTGSRTSTATRSSAASATPTRTPSTSPAYVPVFVAVSDTRLTAGSSATVTATLAYGISSDVTVQLAFSGSATRGVSYTVTAAQIIVPAGSLSASVTITETNAATGMNLSVHFYAVSSTYSVLQGTTYFQIALN